MFTGKGDKPMLLKSDSEDSSIEMVSSQEGLSFAARTFLAHWLT